MIVQYSSSHDIKRPVKILVGEVCDVKEWKFLDEPDIEYESIHISRDSNFAQCSQCVFDEDHVKCSSSPQCTPDQRVYIDVDYKTDYDVGKATRRLYYAVINKQPTVVERIGVIQVEI